MKKIFAIPMIVIGFLFYLYPFVYHIKNPDTTQMEMFLAFWPYYLIGAILMVTPQVVRTFKD